MTLIKKSKTYLKKPCDSKIIFWRQKKTFTAFTLAEVLITLGIIGVVAAMTIPTLIAKNQKQQYVTALKKAYGMTNQALMQITIDYGSPGDLKTTGLFDSTYSGNSNILLGDTLIKYIKASKNCKIAENQNCFASVTNQHYDGSYTGTNIQYDSLGYYKFITPDGIAIALYNSKNDCAEGTNSTGRTGNMREICGIIVIDVNGLKQPNYFGRDTFYFYITNGKGAILYPSGGADDNYSNSDRWWRNSSNNIIRCTTYSKIGLYCAGRVMEENWKMNY